MTRIATSIALAVLATVCTAGVVDASAAQAQPYGGADTYSASIRSGDLNLASASGLATFNGRVKAAADRVCGTAPVLPFNEARAIGQCRAQLIRSAERQVTLAMAGTDSTVAGTR